MTSLHVICGLGPPQSRILATPMILSMPFSSMPTSFVYGVIIDLSRGVIIDIYVKSFGVFIEQNQQFSFDEIYFVHSL